MKVEWRRKRRRPERRWLDRVWDGIKEKGLSREVVFGGVCHCTSMAHKCGNKMKRKKTKAYIRGVFCCLSYNNIMWSQNNSVTTKVLTNPCHVGLHTPVESSSPAKGVLVSRVGDGTLRLYQLCRLRRAWDDRDGFVGFAQHRLRHDLFTTEGAFVQLEQ